MSLKDDKGNQCLAVQGEARDSRPVLSHMSASEYRLKRDLCAGFMDPALVLVGALTLGEGRAGSVFRSVFTCSCVIACMQGCTVREHLYSPRDLLSMHPGRRTSRGMHVREHLCAISSLSHMTLKAPPVLFPALLDSPVCSQVC